MDIEADAVRPLMHASTCAVLGFLLSSSSFIVMAQTPGPSPVLTITTVKYPETLAFDPSGNLWVANLSNNVSELGAPAFRVVKTLGGLSPFGVAFDRGGGLYVSNQENNGAPGNVTIYNATSLASRRAVVTGTIPGLGIPQGLAFDSGGNLWVADITTLNLTEYGAASLSGNPALVKTVDERSLLPGGISFQFVTFDSLGNLWADQGSTNPASRGAYSRVVEISAPSLAQLRPTMTRSFDDPVGIPNGLAFDSCGDLWVAGSGLLGGALAEFNASSLLSLTPKPSFQIPGASGATGLAFDAGGNLWVAEGPLGKILEYSVASLGGCNPGKGFQNGQPASVVLGEPNFTSIATAWGLSKGTNQQGLTTPTSLAFDARGNLWVADSGNDRVVKFEPPFVSAMGASVPVLGHPGRVDFGLPVAFGVVNTNATTMGVPIGVSEGTALQGMAFDAAGNLWLADSANNRVLEFDGSALRTTPEGQPPISASIVIGQSDFTGKSSGTTKTLLSDPTGIAFDTSGDLWVADSGNNRVLEFAPPFKTGEGAVAVVGQRGYTTFTPDRPDKTLGGLDRPLGIAFDRGGDLWVADNLDERVMMFEPPFAPGENSSLIIGEIFDGTRFVTLTGGSGSVGTPVSVAFDAGGNLWVGQSANCKFLEFPFPLKAAENASTVIGQPDFHSNSAATTQSGLNDPAGVAFDASGHLWVADTGNNRVLEYLKAGESNPQQTASSSTNSEPTTISVSQSTQAVPAAAPPVLLYAGFAVGVLVILGVAYAIGRRKVARPG